MSDKLIGAFVAFLFIFAIGLFLVVYQDLPNEAKNLGTALLIVGGVMSAIIYFIRRSSQS